MGTEAQLHAFNRTEQSASRRSRFTHGERAVGWVGPRTCQDALENKESSVPDDN
jgi:hypothetical protein